MKKLVFFLAVLFIGTGGSAAVSAEDKVSSHKAINFGNSFIFVENGITFSVYPDGEFDFFIDQYAGLQAGVAVGPVGITFNSGFNYNPFVQYDDYGAVVQVENVPIFYDYYGRVRRIGDIGIWYRNGLAYRIGGMRVFYNPGGIYSYHTGFINVFNRAYVYRPFHRFFVRPAVDFCLVYNRPYRRFYNPVRYTYYGPYRNNFRRAYARVGRTYRYHARAERSRIYRNDRRVTARHGDFDYQRRSNARRTPSVQERSRMRSNQRVAGNRPSARVNRNDRAVRSNPRIENRSRNARPAVQRKERSSRSSRPQVNATRTSRITERSAEARPVNRSRSIRSTPSATRNRSANKTRSVQSNSRSVQSNRTAKVNRSRNNSQTRVSGSERQRNLRQARSPQTGRSASKSSRSRSGRSGKH